mmetsp:Transcript_26668/g.57970  ORF Transcript_26668/g.57970 Transcript_26668/m.57970 type:complete len:100 (+) Transcript_26668:1643-1942(+)
MLPGPGSPEVRGVRDIVHRAKLAALPFEQARLRGGLAALLAMELANNVAAVAVEDAATMAEAAVVAAAAAFEAGDCEAAMLACGEGGDAIVVVETKAAV